MLAAILQAITSIFKKNNMKQIFGLYGRSNVGKSETIKSVYAKLTEKFTNFIFHENFEPIIPDDRDICVIIIVNGKIIGIESQGDPNSRLFSSLPIFVEFNCDIILCATRTRGATVKEVEKMELTHEINWIKKNPSENNTNHKSDNDKIATDISNLISDKIK